MKNEVELQHFELLNQSGQSEVLSTKYQHQSSQKLVDKMREVGFELSKVTTGKTESNFQKHVMHFEHPELVIDGENKIQALVSNSYDGTSVIRVNLGVLRLVCANGLVAGDSIFSSKVKHIGGDFYDRVVALMAGLTESSKILADQVKLMQNTQLSNLQKMQLATTIAEKRLENVSNLNTFDMRSMTRIIRNGDFGDDLYTFMNVLQEKVIRGGIKYNYEKAVLDDNKNVLRFETARSTTKGITNMDNCRKLNQFVFDESIKLVA